MSINGQKGDIVLSAEKGMIEDVIKAVSGYWEHVGMIVDDGKTIRHNTRYADNIEIDYNYVKVLWWKVKTLPKRFNPDSLANGLPGIISEDIDTAFHGQRARFHVLNGIVVKPGVENESLYRDQLIDAADKMIELDGYYRIGAYSDMFQLPYI